jgi:uncharacterized protein (TIGR02996 family)
MTATDERAAFLAAIRVVPEDDLPRLAFADWLDEHREPAAASDQRRAVHVRRVCRKPDDDVPRLLYAEWLDGQGENSRAEFIRVQCELAGIIEKTVNGVRHYRNDDRSLANIRRAMELERREREFFKAHGRAWADPALSLVCVGEPVPDERDTSFTDGGGHQVRFRRGDVAAVRLSTAAFLGGPCGRCHGRRVMMNWGPEPGSPVLRSHPDYCPACSGTGRVPGLAGTVPVGHPIEEWRLTDKHPWWAGREGGHCVWWEENEYRIEQDGPNRNSNIPPVLFKSMWDSSPVHTHREDQENRWIVFESQAVALEQLSKSCLIHAHTEAEELVKGIT